MADDLGDCSRLQCAVTYVLVASGAMALATGMIAALGPVPLPLAPAAAAMLAAACVPALSLGLRRRLSARSTLAITAGAALAIGAGLAAVFGRVALIAAPAAAAALALIALMVLAVTRRRLRRTPALPDSGGAVWLTDPRWRWASILVAAVMLVQVARLAMLMLTPSFHLGSAWPRYGASHTCLPAYVHAAELASGDRDLYAPLAYANAGTDRDAATAIQGMAGYMGDPYQYPPVFLLAPQALLAGTQDFFKLRCLWFAASTLALLALVTWVTAFAGRASPSLWPLTAAAVATWPFLYNLQFGQAHLLVIAMAVAAMVAFHERRMALGGLLLAAAIASKLFPAILLVVLLMRRRYAAVAWTAAMGILLIALTVAVFGPDSMARFATQQLPALLDGRAFAVFAGDDEMLVANLGAGSLPIKIGALLSMDMPGPVSGAISLCYLLALFALAVVIGRRKEESAQVEVVALLSLVNLASMVGMYAPASYAMGPSMWLLAALVCRLRPTGLALAAWAGLWLFLQTAPVLTAMPIIWKMSTVLLMTSLVSQVAVLSVSAGAALGLFQPRVRDLRSQDHDRTH